MNGKLYCIFFGLSLFVSCENNETGSLTSQLALNFADHMKRIDSSLLLDSFKLIRTDTFFEKQGRMLDVFIYQREQDKIKRQLQNAINLELADSAAFYAYENNFITGEIDSLSKLVPGADTTRAFGIAIHCVYWVRKNIRNRRDSALYFFDNNMKLLDPERIDSDISWSSRHL